MRTSHVSFSTVE